MEILRVCETNRVGSLTSKLNHVLTFYSLLQNRLSHKGLRPTFSELNLICAFTFLILPIRLIVTRIVHWPVLFEDFFLKMEYFYIKSHINDKSTAFLGTLTRIITKIYVDIHTIRYSFDINKYRSTLLIITSLVIFIY